MPDPIAIVGAGIGGLSAAIRLRAKGYDVHVYEKNTAVGGKMSQIAHDGFRWDTGPSVVTMRHVFEDLFRVAQRPMDDYLTFLPVEPLTRYFYPDGTVLDATRDLAQMAQHIAAIDERDIEGYLGYLAYAARIHRITGPVFIYDKPPRPSSFARVPIQDWLKADPLRTMQQAISSFVKSPQLRQLLGRFATYVGGSPYEAPATLNVIAHVELTGGVWYPQGGIYQIASALERLARELGVQLHLNSPVEQIVIDRASQQVTGLAFSDGTSMSSSAVIANSDVTTTYHRHLPTTPRLQARLKRLASYAPSCSGFVLLLGVNQTHPRLAHHNIFFSHDYAGEFRAIFHDLVPANDPTIYVCITSKTDPDHAPQGMENWFILINAPATSERVNWVEYAPRYRDHILALLAQRGYDLRPYIISETCLTPDDLSTMSGAWRGALYGASANSKFTAFRRPHNRCPDVRGLYFAGGTTHPGGGVPMVMLSGKVASDLVHEDYASRHFLATKR